MRLSNLVSTSFLIFGGLLSPADAGLLDSLGGVIGLGINQKRPPLPPLNNNNNFNPNYVRNFNNNNNPNNNPNNYPNNNNFESNPESQGYNDESFNNNNGGDPNRTEMNENSNGNNMRFLNPSKGNNFDLTTRRNILNQGNLELTEKELIAAQKFPELQKLLDKLKEMNRQKELEKQNNLNKSSTFRPPAANNNDGQTVTQNPTNKEVNKRNQWKKLDRRKVFFRVRPVRPENEDVPEDEIVYYLE